MINFEIIIFFLIGLSIGSFINVCIYRLPNNINFIKRSHCPSCKKNIKYLHNIPILSFIFLKGKTFCCNKKISFQYPLVEIIVSILTVFLYTKYSVFYEFLGAVLFFNALIIILFCDLNHFIIPNKITYPLIIIGILISYFNFSPFNISLYEALLGLFASSFLLFLTSKIYFLVRKKEGLGFGDIKMIAMIGVWMGMEAAIFIIIISSFIGSVTGIILIFFKKMQWGNLMPFGTFIALSSFIYWYFNKFKFFELL